MDDFTVKRAVRADLPQLEPLVEAFHVEEGVDLAPATRRSALDLILGEPLIGGVWLAERDGAAIGYFILAFGFAVEFGGRDAFLDEIFVVPACRGAGRGARLLDHVQSAAGALGLRALHLEVHDDNPRAARLYASRGFARRRYRLMSLRLLS